MNKGSVYLVGAGPGDIELITVKGKEVVKKADVILYDRLVNPLLLEHASESAERIYCGKLPDRHHLRQEAIQQIMIDKAKAGKLVARLKGGDPGVFGRVGEEAEALVQEGIRYEIVPGITSGIAAPLYAGVPVTHRNFAKSFAVVTGHSKASDGNPSPNWEALAQSVDTIAFYMGVKNLPLISEKLIVHGKPSSTPVLIIEWGTTSRQKVIEGNLGNINDKAKESRIENPAITLVGDVASLRKELAWFEKKALSGRFVWVVKTSSRPGKIASCLKENGAEVIEAPRYIHDHKNNSIPKEIGLYDALHFYSEESVPMFFQSLKEQKIDIRMLPQKIYGNSKRTIKKLEDLGIFAVHKQENEEGLSTLCIGKLEELPPYSLKKDHWVSHKDRTSQQTRKTMGRLIQDDLINTIVLPCEKAVDVMIEELGTMKINYKEWLKTKTVVCYGPRTRARADAMGIQSFDTLIAPLREELIKSLMKPL